MLTVVSDTHGTDDHRLTGRTLEAVRAADHVVVTNSFSKSMAVPGLRVGSIRPWGRVRVAEIGG